MWICKIRPLRQEMIQGLWPIDRTKKILFMVTVKGISGVDIKLTWEDAYKIFDANCRYILKRKEYTRARIYSIFTCACLKHDRKAASLHVHAHLNRIPYSSALNNNHPASTEVVTKDCHKPDFVKQTKERLTVCSSSTPISTLFIILD